MTNETQYERTLRLGHERRVSDPRPSYMIGEPRDMRTWRTVNGRRLFLGEMLCEGCDAPIADGPCGCLAWRAQ